MMTRPDPRILLLSAIASGQGKTTVTAALARKLQRQGQAVRLFKTGPDFLDPMMLSHVAGLPVDTLDLWMVGEAGCRARLAQAARDADVILIEGVMGLYDGTPSSADLANALGIPVLAIIDGAAMAQTAGALVAGLRDYGPVDVAGVIANRVSHPAHATMIADALRGVPLLGRLPPQQAALPERHLGLYLPQEVASVDALMERLADSLVLDETAWQALPGIRVVDEPSPRTASLPLAGRTIAVARDAAFAFLYPANIDCLHQLGASTRFFSPLADEPVPAAADALYLPGGYPELHAETLSRAHRWQASVRAAHLAGMPILAECGGMMTLAAEIADADGRIHAMAGLLPGRVAMQRTLAAIGPHAWDAPQGQLRGHAFHFSRFDTPLAAAAHTFAHPAHTRGEAIYRQGNLTASYFHAYFPSCPAAVVALFTAGGHS